MNFFQKYKSVIILFVIWMIVQSALFYVYGVRHGSDTPRYLQAADNILARKFPTGKSTAYLGYDFFVASILMTGLGERTIILFQVLLTLISSYCLYRLTFKFSQNKTASFFAVFLYVTAFRIHMWNFYILTDSLFISMTIISLYLISNFEKIHQIWYTAPIIFYTACIRPTGFVLFISTMIYAFARLIQLRKYKTVFWISILMLISFPLFYKAVDSMVLHMHVVDNYLKGQIIWGYDKIAVDVPASIAARYHANSGNSLGDIAAFIFNHPAYVTKLSFLKFYYFLIHIKPFYWHIQNILIALSYYPAYFFFISGFLKKRDFPTKAFLLSYAAIQTIIVLITFEDWDGRFLETIMPIVYIFAGLGFLDYLPSFSHNLRKKDAIFSKRES